MRVRPEKVGAAVVLPWWLERRSRFDVEVGLCVKQGGGHAPGDANVGWSFLNRFSLP